MKVNMQRIILIVTIFLLIGYTMTSCDPEIGYKYYLNNNSDSLLSVHFKCYSIKKDSVKIVDPKTEILIFEKSVMGANPRDEGNYFLKMFDTISVLLQSGIPIKTDIYKRENWKYSNDISHFGLIKTGTNIYTLDLTNDNLK